MQRMNPFVKSALAFVGLFVLAVGFAFVRDVAVLHTEFRLDLAMSLGIAMGGSVMLLVHDLTKDNG